VGRASEESAPGAALSTPAKKRRRALVAGVTDGADGGSVAARCVSPNPATPATMEVHAGASVEVPGGSSAATHAQLPPEGDVQRRRLAELTEVIDVTSDSDHEQPSQARAPVAAAPTSHQRRNQPRAASGPLARLPRPEHPEGLFALRVNSCLARQLPCALADAADDVLDSWRPKAEGGRLDPATDRALKWCSEVLTEGSPAADIRDAWRVAFVWLDIDVSWWTEPKVECVGIAFYRAETHAKVLHVHIAEVVPKARLDPPVSSPICQTLDAFVCRLGAVLDCEARKLSVPPANCRPAWMHAGGKGSKGWWAGDQSRRLGRAVVRRSWMAQTIATLGLSGDGLRRQYCLRNRSCSASKR
jgi:hypothetical protein